MESSPLPRHQLLCSPHGGPVEYKTLKLCFFFRQRDQKKGLMDLVMGAWGTKGGWGWLRLQHRSFPPFEYTVWLLCNLLHALNLCIRLPWKTTGLIRLFPSKEVHTRVWNSLDCQYPAVLVWYPWTCHYGDVSPLPHCPQWLTGIREGQCDLLWEPAIQGGLRDL